MGALRSRAPGRIRTCDTRFRRAVLYPLSYEGEDATWISVRSATSLADKGRGMGRFLFSQVRPWGRG